ncbi:MAG TPA: hypothetical protein VIH37_08555 [Candidatus Limnocylindrales bacterium]
MSGTAPVPPVAGTPEPTAPVPTPPPAPPTPPEQTPGTPEYRIAAAAKVNGDLETKLNGARDELAALKAENARLSGKEAEFQAAQESARVQSEATAKANERVVRRAIREHAATRMSDPADALLYLDVSKYPVDENGDVDDAAIKAAVEDLVKSKPYLAAQGGTPGTVFTSPTSAREGQSEGQWTEAQLAAATPEQITAALAKGLLKDVLGGTSH